MLRQGHDAWRFSPVVAARARQLVTPGGAVQRIRPVAARLAEILKHLAHAQQREIVQSHSIGSGAVFAPDLDGIERREHRRDLGIGGGQPGVRVDPAARAVQRDAVIGPVETRSGICGQVDHQFAPIRGNELGIDVVELAAQAGLEQRIVQQATGVLKNHTSPEGRSLA